jgi:hypothetical protein
MRVRCPRHFLEMAKPRMGGLVGVLQIEGSQLEFAVRGKSEVYCYQETYQAHRTLHERQWIGLGWSISLETSYLAPWPSSCHYSHR